MKVDVHMLWNFYSFKIAKAWTMVRIAGTADGMRKSEILCRWHSFVVRANVPVAQKANCAD